MHQWRIVDGDPSASAFTLERMTAQGEYAAYDSYSLPEKARRLIMQFLLSKEAWIDRREGAQFFCHMMG